jgi:predicted nucleotidyltransferase
MFELSDPDRGLLEQTYALRFRLKFARLKMLSNFEAIESLVQNIIKTVHPLKIILFGSYARGKTGPDSDIDVLVVMPEGVHCRRTAQLLYRQIRGLESLLIS